MSFEFLTHKEFRKKYGKSFIEFVGEEGLTTISSFKFIDVQNDKDLKNEPKK